MNNARKQHITRKASNVPARVLVEAQCLPDLNPLIHRKLGVRQYNHNSEVRRRTGLLTALSCLHLYRRLCLSLRVQFARLQLCPLLAFAVPFPKSEIHEESCKSTRDEEEPLRTTLFSGHPPNRAHQDDLENEKSGENENSENVIQARTSKTGVVSCRKSSMRPNYSDTRLGRS